MPDAGRLSAVERLVSMGDLVTPIAVRVANGLGIADALGDERLSLDQLAGRLKAERAVLGRLLSLLRHCGLVDQAADDRYLLTDMGGVLRQGHKLSMRDAFLVAETELSAWLRLEDAVRAGKAAFELARGEPHRQYRARHPEEDARMDRIHKAATRVDLVTLARVYPWQDIETIVDLGGGTGMFLCGLLQRFGNLRGILFDLPRMIETAPDNLAAYGVADRCTIVGGDFFEQIPAGHDVYVLKAVLGGWSEEDAVRILENIRGAMKRDARLLIIEPVMGPGTGYARANAMQLHTFVLYGGRYRDIADYESLAERAGLEIRQVIPRATLPIVELGAAC